MIWLKTLMILIVINIFVLVGIIVWTWVEEMKEATDSKELKNANRVSRKNKSQTG